MQKEPVMSRRTKKDQETPVLRQILTSSLGRSSKLLSLSVSAGLDAAVHSARAFLNPEKKAELSHDFWTTQAKRITQELGKLKGSLQKAGQLFSIYGEHFLPPEVAAILKSLHKDSPPLSNKAILGTAKRSLGPERFARLTFEPTPIGAASIGQVYRVNASDVPGQWCLKVQYPGVSASIDSDLKNLQRIFNILKFIPRDMNLDGIFAEIRTMLHREVDYQKEADATDQFAGWLESDDRFVVPRILREYSTKRVIASSYEEGVDIDSTEVFGLSPERRARLGEAILDLFFLEFFSFRTVQTDPHFGNYRIRINENGRDQWVLLDFGAVRTFSESFVTHYHSITRAVVFDANPEGLFHSLKALGIMRDSDTAKEIEAVYAISRLVSEPFLSDQIYEWGRTALAQRVADQVKKLLFDLGVRRPPPELVFLDRKIGGVFTILQKLDCSFAPRAVLSRYVES
jgi:predicted unusual protein kinase regulating ubiquinone biosynthesis (AarF/ABC1/UbiB family)